MKNVYFLVKFWVLIKVAHIRLKKIKVGFVFLKITHFWLKKIKVNFVGEEQEKLKNFLLEIIDKISSFLMVSHSSKLCKICRRYSEDLIDLSVGLHETYSFPVWDNLVFYASDLRTFTYRTDQM